MAIHPRYIFGALDPEYYDGYKRRNRVRALQSYKAMSDMMIKNSLVKIKEHPPYTGDMEGKVLLNSMARATFDPKTGEYSFKGKLSSTAPMDTSNVQTVSTILSMNNIFDGSSVAGVGVDQGMLNFDSPNSTDTHGFDAELISSVPSHNPTFVARNFTENEITYCRAQPSPSASFAARWVGKEAVFKSLGIKSKGAAAPMKDIEIINDESGVPTVHLHGDARAKAEEKGITNVLISLSHSEVRNTFLCPNPISEFALRMLPLPSPKPLRNLFASHFNVYITDLTFNSNTF